MHVHNLSRGSNQYKHALRLACSVLGYEPEADKTIETLYSDNASFSSDEKRKRKGSEESEIEVTESDSNEDFSCNYDGEIDWNLDEPENTKKKHSFCFTLE